MPANTKVVDFKCARCTETYQVKSQRHLNLSKVTDGAYSAMVSALQENSAPNLLILNYSLEWTVKNLVLIPSVVFTEDALEKRKPLGELARRRGWIGCNILLNQVPPDAKIPIVIEETIVPASEVRRKYDQYRVLEAIPWEVRGWSLDVLNVVRKIKVSEFGLEQIYAHEFQLGRMHPANKNIRAKIRQQLQILRDFGFIKFIGKGRYRVLPTR